ncbi:hypothetical protein SO3561_07774 [Streptomyces olivochromogenes]|uniref:Uncharacterized protein n=1 Tax=Streptomyces olivochromogenes TaxID=1963 RepID=A0A250VPU1_STROL|nr:hypothetical protein SO3561_07774 [Streptomyces olivochromogenes]
MASLRYSASAMARLLRPSASNRTTSISRWLKSCSGSTTWPTRSPTTSASTALCPALTASPGELLPRAKRTSCRASAATQSQPYFRAYRL